MKKIIVNILAGLILSGSFKTSAQTDIIRPSATIDISETGVIGTGTDISITATFSEPMYSAPQIALSGANYSVALPTSFLSDSILIASHIVQPGSGKVDITLSGMDLAGNQVMPIPVSGASFYVKPFFYGDVDDNGYIQAYDAVLALQHSLGSDLTNPILPDMWDSWRYRAANVDEKGDIAANDAALILKNSTNITTQFPASLKSAASTSDINISIEYNALIFRSRCDLYGFNLFAGSNIQALDTPVVLGDSIMSIFDIGSDRFKVGLASAFPLKENTAFLKIPLKDAFQGNLTFNMILNTDNIVKSINTVTSVYKEELTNAIIYPNPAYHELYVHIPCGLEFRKVFIYNIEGTLVLEEDINAKTAKINISSLPTGVYLIKLRNSKTFIVQKFIKK
jgi:hypothetical protein